MKKRIIFIIAVLIVFPLNINAEGIMIDCPNYVLPGNTFECKVLSNEPSYIIKGLKINTEHNGLSYVSNKSNENWLNVVTNSNGTVLVNNSEDNTNEITRITYMVPQGESSGKVYNVVLSDIVLSDGNSDYYYNNISASINTISSTNIVTKITIDGEPLEINDGVSNYTYYTIGTKSIFIDIKLSNENYSFIEGYGPRTVELQSGENNIEIKIKDDKSEIITYNIKIINNELEKEENSITNVDTGSFINTMIVASLVVLLLILLFVSNDKKKFYKI